MNAGAPNETKERTGMADQGMWPPMLHPMDAPFVRNTGPAAILSCFPSRLLDTSLAHAIGFIQTLVLGPEIPWRGRTGDSSSSIVRLSVTERYFG